MSMFRKKPVVIEARQFCNAGSSYAVLQWINEGQHAIGRELAQWHNGQIMVPTLEGQHIASPGDWIIRGVAGEHYPCKPDIFEATYEAVESATKGAHALRAALAQPAAPDAIEREREARKAAQIENEALKARLARQRIDLIRELREQGWAQPDAQPVAWQPIETAPKDGTGFIGYWPTPMHDCSMHAIKWHKGRWWQTNEDFPASEPTHWMPMPPAPGAAQPAPQPLSERELQLIDGMIEVQLHHAAQCDGIANRTMAVKQKGWDMERVELLRKLRGITAAPTTGEPT